MIKRILFIYAIVSMACTGIIVSISLGQHPDNAMLPLWVRVISIVCLPGMFIAFTWHVKSLFKKSMLNKQFRFKLWQWSIIVKFVLLTFVAVSGTIASIGLIAIMLTFWLWIPPVWLTLTCMAGFSMFLLTGTILGHMQWRESHPRKPRA